MEVNICNESYINYLVNIYEDIDEYMILLSDFECGTDRVFLAVNHSATNRRTFLNGSMLG